MGKHNIDFDNTYYLLITLCGCDMKEKLKQHASKLYLILAFISGGGLTQVGDFIFTVKEAFRSESKTATVSQIDDGDFKNEIRYVEKDFQLNRQKAESYK